MSRTTAVVLTWNSADDSIACVRSLQEQQGTTVDIVLVDNASTDDSADRLQAEFPSLPLLTSDENLGYAGGNNIGIRHAMDRDSEFVLVLNNDTVLEPDAVRILEETLDTHPNAGIASPKILYDGDRNRIYAAGGYLSRMTCTGVAGQQGQLDASSEAIPSEVTNVSFVSGCAMLVRKSVFESVGLLSERFFMYFEDLEFSERVVARYHLLYVPASRIYHKVGAGVTWKDYSPLYNFYYTRNRLWFFLQGPVWYRPYVILFTLTNILMKTLVLIPAMAGLGSTTNAGDKVRALWRGLAAGVRPGEGRV